MAIHVLDEGAVRRLAPMKKVIAEIRDTLIRIEAGEFETPQRLQFSGGFGLAMPVWHRPTRSVVVKTLTVDGSREPRIKGTISWVGPGEQDPVVVDAASVTAIRTAAIVGVAADFLAPATVRKAVVFGTGAQGIEQARALLAVRPLTHVVFVGRNPDRAERAAQTLADETPGLRVDAVTDARAHLEDADIIGCATPSLEPLFDHRGTKENAFFAAIGSYVPAMHELPQALLAEVGRVYVDEVQACLEEAGELIDALAAGTLGLDGIVPLGQVLRKPAEPVVGRRIFKSVGIAPQDWAAMNVLTKSLAEDGLK
ncbi:ornithine cyclodeaminase [Novosphingobium nitrogenifigens DSM 19370]|uniref:Ornithine cyclodeaminase n=1 Tax=Novosphingobium nitrogenifigens DSM 19370 TaxID=983920 RepID=F1Z5L1_9SPHN|nr:ornithine cyclodeaminase family protein [Novosphingobium nitrogenifigens]EGD60121.1 ornithine cyclodeaminase [Novosphingobium nitrogenifigens DSM 19370]